MSLIIHTLLLMLSPFAHDGRQGLGKRKFYATQKDESYVHYAEWD